ncbi:MAG TPA: hypothetical protein VIH67_04850 [Candidatus Acidoferrum sp.]
MGLSAASAAIVNLFAAPSESPNSEQREQTHSGLADDPKAALRRRVKEEARSLFQLVGQSGETARSIREQIYIQPHIARDLFRFVEDHPDEGCWILGAIEFRNRVLREFDALASSAEHAERIAAAEEEATRRTAAEIPVLPVLHELVVESVC